MGDFKTEVNKDQEKQLLQIGLVLYKSRLIISPTKYSIAKFALLNLIEGMNKGIKTTIEDAEHGSIKKG